MICRYAHGPAPSIPSVQIGQAQDEVGRAVGLLGQGRVDPVGRYDGVGVGTEDPGPIRRQRGRQDRGLLDQPRANEPDRRRTGFVNDHRVNPAVPSQSATRPGLGLVGTTVQTDGHPGRFDAPGAGPRSAPGTRSPGRRQSTRPRCAPGSPPARPRPGSPMPPEAVPEEGGIVVAALLQHVETKIIDRPGEVDVEREAGRSAK